MNGQVNFWHIQNLISSAVVYFWLNLEKNMLIALYKLKNGWHFLKANNLEIRKISLLFL